MNIDKLIAQEAEASEANPDAPEKPGTRVTRGVPRGRTLQVRLTAEEYAELEAAAAASELPVSSYARNLLLVTAEPAAEPTQLIGRIQMDLDKLSAITRRATPAKSAAKKATPARKAATAKKAAKKATRSAVTGRFQDSETGRTKHRTS